MRTAPLDAAPTIKQVTYQKALLRISAMPPAESSVRAVKSMEAAVKWVRRCRDPIPGEE